MVAGALAIRPRLAAATAKGVARKLEVVAVRARADPVARHGPLVPPAASAAAAAAAAATAASAAAEVAPGVACVGRLRLAPPTAILVARELDVVAPRARAHPVPGLGIRHAALPAAPAAAAAAAAAAAVGALAPMSWLRGLLTLGALHVGAFRTAPAADGVARELVVAALCALPVLLEARPAFAALAALAPAAAAAAALAALAAAARRAVRPWLWEAAAAAAGVACELVVAAARARAYPVALLETRVPAAFAAAGPEALGARATPLLVLRLVVGVDRNEDCDHAQQRENGVHVRERLHERGVVRLVADPDELHEVLEELGGQLAHGHQLLHVPRAEAAR